MLIGLLKSQKGYLHNDRQSLKEEISRDCPPNFSFNETVHSAICGHCWWNFYWNDAVSKVVMKSSITKLCMHWNMSIIGDTGR